MTRRLLILTEQGRDNNWTAVVGPYRSRDPIGTGPTEGDAVADLYHQIAEREADDSDRYDHEIGAA